MEIFLIIIAVILVIWYLRTFKVPKVGSLTLVTGGVKAGKSTFAIYLTLRTYKRVLRSWKIRCFFIKLIGKFSKKDKWHTLPERPLLYSNIPLAENYVPLTDDLLLRNKRFAFGSVIYCGEVSLVADSQLYKNMTLNERLLLFNKLIGHELHGGAIIYDTQSIQDCHYSIKRCLSDYFYIHHVNKFVPFFLVAYVIQSRYSDDNSVVTVDVDDVEHKLCKVVIPKSIWKKFDAWCYSAFTDKLDPVTNVVYNKGKKAKTLDLKCYEVCSFRSLDCLYENEVDIHEKEKT